MSAKTSIQLNEEKIRVSHIAASWVPNGCKIGLGSGSTIAYFIEYLGERVRNEGLKISGVPTSEKSAELARKASIPLLEPSRGLVLDLTVDGADEIDPNLTLTKGGGGALLREKVIASISKYLLIIADSSKLVSHLGAFPLPLEVIPFSVPLVMDKIEALGGKPSIRENPHTHAYQLTDQQNVLLDCRFEKIEDPGALARKLEVIPGIAEHGLFLNYAHAAVVADGTNVSVYRKGLPTTTAQTFTALPS